METIKKRIEILKKYKKQLTETIYPDGYDEAKFITLCALQDRIDTLEFNVGVHNGNVNKGDVEYLPTNQRG